jgi:acetyl esterase/lipase
MLAFAIFVSTPPSAAQRAETMHSSPVGEENVYKRVDDRELKLWVVKPAGWKASDRRPAVVFLHGGGGVGGNANQFNEHCRYLPTRGMACVQVQFRLLTKPDEPPTVCCRDANSAMRWVRSHAGKLGIDPRRIAAGAGSTGGHLAAVVGKAEGTDDPAEDQRHRTTIPEVAQVDHLAVRGEVRHIRRQVPHRQLIRCQVPHLVEKRNRFGRNIRW